MAHICPTPVSTNIYDQEGLLLLHVKSCNFNAIMSGQNNVHEKQQPKTCNQYGVKSSLLQDVKRCRLIIKHHATGNDLTSQYHMRFLYVSRLKNNVLIQKTRLQCTSKFAKPCFYLLGSIHFMNIIFLPTYKLTQKYPSTKSSNLDCMTLKDRIVGFPKCW